MQLELSVNRRLLFGGKYMKRSGLERISERVIREAIGRAPLDQYVVWDGSQSRLKPNSICSRALACIQEVWTPVSLRVLMQRAAYLAGELGLDPERVRKAVRQHQSARPTAYLLVRRAATGDYLAVTDVPWPSRAAALRAGDLVLDRVGNPFGQVAVGEPLSGKAQRPTDVGVARLAS